MFKGIKDKFKRKSSEKYFAANVGSRVNCSRVNKGVSKIGCIVDLDLVDNANMFYDLIKEHKLKPNAVKIIGYKKVHDKNSPYSTPVFSGSDIGYNGKIENNYALEFLNREFDVLISYYNTDNLALKLMTLQTRARVKVGFGEVDCNLNDLIMNIPLKDFSLFKAELGKYLKVLNELE
mgnify:FL=1